MKCSKKLVREDFQRRSGNGGNGFELRQTERNTLIKFPKIHYFCRIRAKNKFHGNHAMYSLYCIDYTAKSTLEILEMPHFQDQMGKWGISRIFRTSIVDCSIVRRGNFEKKTRNQFSNKKLTKIENFIFWGISKNANSIT